MTEHAHIVRRNFARIAALALRKLLAEGLSLDDAHDELHKAVDDALSISEETSIALEIPGL